MCTEYGVLRRTCATSAPVVGPPRGLAFARPGLARSAQPEEEKAGCRCRSQASGRSMHGHEAAARPQGIQGIQASRHPGTQASRHPDQPVTQTPDQATRPQGIHAQGTRAASWQAIQAVKATLGVVDFLHPSSSPCERPPAIPFLRSFFFIFLSIPSMPLPLLCLHR